MRVAGITDPGNNVRRALKRAHEPVHLDWARIAIVTLILTLALATNLIVNTKFPEYQRSTEQPIELERLRKRTQNGAMLYRGFPSKLHHAVPQWVERGALFHIRIAIEREKNQRPLSKIVGDWKHFQSRKHGIIWQEGYFDHRLRDDERGQQLSAKLNYIRHNPVAAGLCARAEDWPWIIDDAKGGASSPLLDIRINAPSAPKQHSPAGRPIHL